MIARSEACFVSASGSVFGKVSIGAQARSDAGANVMRAGYTEFSRCRVYCLDQVFVCDKGNTVTAHLDVVDGHGELSNMRIEDLEGEQPARIEIDPWTKP